MNVAREDIRRHSLAELAEMNEKGDYVPTPPDAPTCELDEDFWRDARVVGPAAKASVHLRVDADVLEWFKAQGRGHLARMNAALRSYMEAQTQRPPENE